MIDMDCLIGKIYKVSAQVCLTKKLVCGMILGLKNPHWINTGVDGLLVQNGIKYMKYQLSSQ